MLIIDMPMPKFCIWRDDKNEPRRCPLLNEDDDCVLQDSNIRMGWNEQYAHCPIKGALPEEHGDLIDRDAYLKLLESYIESKRGVCENKEIIVALQAISKQINCVKAVIAAERKDDG